MYKKQLEIRRPVPFLWFVLWLLLAVYHTPCSATSSSKEQQRKLCEKYENIKTVPNYPGVVCELLKNGADPNAKDNKGLTPLHNAAVVNALENVEILMAYGADVNAQAQNGYSPLHYAVQEDLSDMATLLLKHNADVNMPAKNGMTPLHISAYYGNEKVAALLVGHGANLNAREQNGLTPLDVARMQEKQFMNDLHMSSNHVEL